MKLKGESLASFVLQISTEKKPKIENSQTKENLYH